MSQVNDALDVLHNHTLKEMLKEAHDIELQICEAGGELTEEVEAKLCEVTTGTLTKVDQTAFVLDSLESRAMYFKAKATYLTTIYKALNRHIERREANIFAFMKEHGMAQLEGDTHVMKIVKNPDSVVIDDENKIPPIYQTITVTSNKSEIKDAIKKGVAVPGAHLDQKERMKISLRRGS